MIAVGDRDISKLLKIADKIWEASLGKNIDEIRINTHSSQASQNIDEIASLQSEIRELTRRLKNLESRPSRSFQRNQNQRRPSKSRFCWYHQKYGKEANSCVKPCFWKSNEKN